MIPRIGEKGSPPRVRGKDPLAAQADIQLGITPARAGKSTAHGGCGNQNGDHPRACGEKRIMYERGSRAAGSPPRVRGKD